ncbi:MAG: hypothetical protein Q8L54_09625 [Devosia sp.]|nr:hypothetical protein [Devosia sp.]
MVAGLLYLIGLVAVLVSVAIAGYSAPAMITSFTAAMDVGDANVFEIIGELARGLAWASWPVIVGLALMGFGRVIMLLSAINRSLRGQN